MSQDAECYTTATHCVSTDVTSQPVLTQVGSSDPAAVLLFLARRNYCCSRTISSTCEIATKSIFWVSCCGWMCDWSLSLRSPGTFCSFIIFCFQFSATVCSGSGEDGRHSQWFMMFKTCLKDGSGPGITLKLFFLWRQIILNIYCTSTELLERCRIKSLLLKNVVMIVNLK